MSARSLNPVRSSIYDRRLLCLALIVAVTALLAVPATNVGVDNSLDVWLPNDDPAYREYARFQASFGNDETVVAAVNDENGFLTPAGLERLQRMAEDLREVEGVKRVSSVANFRSAELEGLLSEGGSLAEYPAVKDRLLSADQRTALLVMELDESDDIDRVRPVILQGIGAALEPHGDYRLAGVGVTYEALNDLAMRDSFRLGLIGYWVMVVLLSAMLKRPRYIVAVLSAGGLANVWTMGLYGLAGKDINMVTTIIPSLVLVITVSTCVHLFHQARLLPAGLSARQRVRQTLDLLLLPIAFNVLTSAAGFLSLTLSPVSIVRDLGSFSALGLIAVFPISVVVFIVAVAGGKHSAATAGADGRAGFAAVLTGTALRRPRTVLLVSGIVTLAALIGASRIEVDTDSLGFLDPQHPVPVDSRYIEANVGAYAPLEFVVSGSDVLTAPVISAVARWQAAAVASGDVAWGHSLANYTGSPLAGATLAALKRSRFMSDGWPFMVNEPDELRVSFGIPMQSARSLAGAIERVGALARMPDGFEARPSGYLPLYTRTMDLIVETLATSFVAAFVAVFCVIGILFRSFRTVALAIPANLLPVFLTLGIMGWAGIRLDVATVTIAAIILGLVVDDTIHFLYRYRLQCRRHGNEHAVMQTARSVGRSMSMTTLILGGGLLVLAFAEIKSVVWFGVLVGCGMTAALLADLVVLPALLTLFPERPRHASAS